MLDRMFVRYVAIDVSPQRAIEARNKGLPVFYGDVNRPEVLKSFDIGSAKACVVTVDDMTATNKAIVNIRKSYPDVPIIVRAKDSQHQKRLENMFDGVYAMSPVLAEDSVLLTLPFGGAVLQKIGMTKPEIDAILEDFRKVYMDDKGIGEDDFDFLNTFQKRLPPSIPVIEPEVIEVVVADDLHSPITVSISSDNSDSSSTSGTKATANQQSAEKRAIPFDDVEILEAPKT